MRAFIYILTFSDGKKYVGQTRRSVAERLDEHRYDMSRGIKRPLYEAWRAFGEPYCAVMECVVDELNELEIFVIDEIGSRFPNGYNAVPGGGFLPQLDPVIAARIAEIHRTAPHLLAKIRKAQKIRWERMTTEERSAWMRIHKPHSAPHTAEAKARISAAVKGRLKDIPKSLEHAAKVGAANRGQKRSPDQIERIRQGAIRGHVARKLREELRNAG